MRSLARGAETNRTMDGAADLEASQVAANFMDETSTIRACAGKR
jgi:hypothetical protein